MRQYCGTGLGLPIAWHLAKALGGDIRVRSRPGGGSFFALFLTAGNLDGVPMLKQAPLGPFDLPPADSSPQRATSIRGRILLVEDGLDNHRLISLILRKAGAEVTVAENGRKAVELAWFQRSPDQPNTGVSKLFDANLMGMQTPVMDGHEATRQLRRHGYSGPILALTAHAMSHDRQKCLDTGCDEFIAKPIDRVQFLTMIAKYSPEPSTQSRPT